MEDAVALFLVSIPAEGDLTAYKDVGQPVSLRAHPLRQWGVQRAPPSDPGVYVMLPDGRFQLVLHPVDMMETASSQTISGQQPAVTMLSHVPFIGNNHGRLNSKPIALAEVNGIRTGSLFLKQVIGRLTYSEATRDGLLRCRPHPTLSTVTTTETLLFQTEGKKHGSTGVRYR